MDEQVTLSTPTSKVYYQFYSCCNCGSKLTTTSRPPKKKKLCSLLGSLYFNENRPYLYSELSSYLETFCTSAQNPEELVRLFQERRWFLTENWSTHIFFFFSGWSRCLCWASVWEGEPWEMQRCFGRITCLITLKRITTLSQGQTLPCAQKSFPLYSPQKINQPLHRWRLHNSIRERCP